MALAGASLSLISVVPSNPREGLLRVYNEGKQPVVQWLFPVASKRLWLL